LSLLALAETDEPRMPQVVVGSPLEELELADEQGLSHCSSAIFALVRPCPHLPLFASVRFANALVDLNPSKSLEQLRARDRREQRTLAGVP
jgi:hypothetical protein